MKTKSDQIMFIAQQVAELRGITIEGFKGVNNHLAELNGKVAAHSKWIGQQNERNAEENGEKKGTTWAWKIVIGGIVILISIFGIFAASGCWGIVCNTIK